MCTPLIVGNEGMSKFVKWNTDDPRLGELILEGMFTNEPVDNGDSIA
jgi:hypothetical protein